MAKSKKPKPEAAFDEIEAAEEPAVEAVEEPKEAPAEEPRKEPTNSVYIGPNIRGTIQHVTIYQGDKEEALQDPGLALAVAKYPGIADLVVSIDGLIDSMKAVKTPGTELYKAYKSLVKSVRKK